MLNELEKEMARTTAWFKAALDRIETRLDKLMALVQEIKVAPPTVKRSAYTPSEAAALLDRATYTEPFQYSDGIEYVLVNGQVVLDAGKHTGARPGKALRGKS